MRSPARPFAVLLLVQAACHSAGDDGDSSSGSSTSAEDGVGSSSSPDVDDASTDGGVTGSDTTGVPTSTSGAESSTGSSGDGLMAVDDEYFVPQEAELHVDVADGVIVNDTHAEGASLDVIPSDGATTNGGAVAVFEDGHFDYTPPPGYWGADSFEYTVATDAGETAVGVVTVFVTPVSIPLSRVAQGIGGFVLDGEELRNYCGGAVAGGDVDGDGISDVVTTAQGFGDHAGRSYVVPGGTEPETSDLTDLTSSGSAIALTGEQASQQSGRAVDVAGDVNGDGVDDLVIGAWDTNIGGVYQVGRSYVVFGGAELASLDLDAIAAGEGGFAIDGTGELDHAGFVLSAAGDVNGDRLADVVIGTYHQLASAGDPDVAFVVFGKADTDPVSLANVRAGIGGFAILGENAGEYLEVSDAGDLDEDGLADLLIASPLSNAAGVRAGRAYVVFGKTDTAEVALADVAAGIGGWAMDGESPNDLLGTAIDALGDVNGDGLPDLVVGASGAPNGTDVGRSYVIFGTGDRTPIASGDIVAGTDGFVIDGTFTGGGAAYIDLAGDVNADGLADLAVSTYNAPEGTMLLHVVFGKADTTAVTLADVAEGQGGYGLVPEAGAGCCIEARAAGDVDADGVDDLVIGIPYALESFGRTYVVYGVRTQP